MNEPFTWKSPSKAVAFLSPVADKTTAFLHAGTNSLDVYT